MHAVETTDSARGARHAARRQMPHWTIALLAAAGSVSAIWAAVADGAAYTLSH